MSKIATIMARSKVTVGDLSLLSGISRPTVNKVLGGQGEFTWQHKREAVVETLREIAGAVKTGHLPIERIGRENPKARAERLRAAIEASKAPVEDTTSGADEA